MNPSLTLRDPARESFSLATAQQGRWLLRLIKHFLYEAVFG